VTFKKAWVKEKRLNITKRRKGEEGQRNESRKRSVQEPSEKENKNIKRLQRR